jgi:tripartite-type tricarboxylate transporter receptor subunit TctC
MMARLVQGVMGRIAVAAAMFVPAIAAADDYPARPITIVVPYTPGASTDAVARITHDAMSKALGQPIIIDNKPGAGGTIGAALVAAAKPDGYTLLLTVNPPITMNVYSQKGVSYDPRTAFAPISLTAESILVLAVNASLPVKTVPQLVEYAKKNPGKLAYGSAGVGSSHQIAGELIKQKTGIDIVHVPYHGSAPAIQDLVAGNIQISFGTTPAVLPHVQSGAIRILAIAEAKRFPDLPDVPTIDESVPGVITRTWLGLFAPAGTPRPIIDKLNKAVGLALKQPDVIEKLKLQGVTTASSTPEELGAIAAAELDMWGKMLPSIGIVPE